MEVPMPGPTPHSDRLTDAEVDRLREAVIALMRGCEIHPATIEFCNRAMLPALAELSHRRAADARLRCGVIRPRRAA
jgi:hypothetical protein